MVLCADLRSAGKREPQVILAVDGNVGNQASPHSFVELGHCLRQFLQSLDEPVKLPFLRSQIMALTQNIRK